MAIEAIDDRSHGSLDGVACRPSFRIAVVIRVVGKDSVELSG
jgi:hypothetical protein